MPDFAVATAFTGKGNIVSYMGQAGAAVDKFGNRASSAFKRVNSSGFSLLGMAKSLVPAFGIYQIYNYANKAITAWEEQQAAIANVEAGLKSTNNAIGMTSKQFDEMASKAQKAGIFGDEKILQNATAQLLTFGNISKVNFERVQNSVLDVTAKLYGLQASGEQIRSTSIMMGKAMEDPVRGLTAMRRIGISFNATEEQMIKSMIAGNNTIGAQNAMLKIIERQYGGTNAALAKTDKGMQIVAQNAIGDSMEELGKILVPLKKSLIEIAVAILPYVNDGMQAITSIIKSASPIIIGLAAGFTLYKIALMGVWTAQKIMMIAGWIQYLWMMRAAIMQAVSVTKIWQGVQWLLNAAMSANPIVLIIMAVAALTLGIIYLINHLEEAKKLFMDITSILDKPWVQALLSMVPGMNIVAATRQRIKEQQQAPNQTEVESRRQNVDISGSIGVYAPEGTKVEKSKNSSPGFDFDMMGPNTSLGAFGSY